MVRPFLSGLVFGTLYDAVGVLFVRFVADHSPGRAALVSMTLLSIAGMDTALRKGRWSIAGVVIGYGLGTYLTV
jgi:hypothetical protein